MKKNLFIMLALLCLANSLFASTATVEAQFDAANKLYAQNKFTDAAAAYESILATGAVSPALYFNLGNARFKAGQLGHAIAAYQQTRTFTPRDPDLVANLKFARNQVQGPTIKASAFTNLFSNLTLTEWTFAGAGSVWILFSLMTIRQIKPSLNATLRTWTFASSALAILLCAGLWIAHWQNTENTIAIVTAKDATVRNSPLEQSPSTFVAQDGAELRVLDAKDDWLQVTDGTRRVGWLTKSSVSFIVR